MIRILAGVLVLGLVAIGAAQPPEGKGNGPPDKDKMKDKGRPPGFDLGTVIPPFLRGELQLTADQEKQLDALEKEVKERLAKILTAEQKARAENMRLRGPGGFGGDRGKGSEGKGNRPKGGEGKGPKGGEGKGDRPPQNNVSQPSGIQWYSTLNRGLAEAKRTGMPILFVSAAPHCGGVPGIW